MEDKICQELLEFHDLMDSMGIDSGPAMDRVVAWVRRRALLARVNGHQDSCQCLTCIEERAVEKFLQKLKDAKAREKDLCSVVVELGG